MTILWPLPPEFRFVTSPFGCRPAPTKGASTEHNGIDIRCPEGTEIRSPVSGSISRVWTTKSGTDCLMIEDCWFKFGFAHLLRIGIPSLKSGDEVRKGQVIGYTGGTPGTPGAGASTGPHLHLTVRRYLSGLFELIDPMGVEWVDSSGATVKLEVLR